MKNKTLTTIALVLALAISVVSPALSAGGAMIDAPAEGEVYVTGTLALSASYAGWESNDTLNWRITSNADCSTGNNRVGDGPNVTAPSDDIISSSYNEGDFDASIDTSSWDPGEYCFVFNPAGTSDAAVDSVTFFLTESVVTKDDCKDGGWTTLGDYKNQGQCVSEYARNK